VLFRRIWQDLTFFKKQCNFHYSLFPLLGITFQLDLPCSSLVVMNYLNRSMYQRLCAIQMSLLDMWFCANAVSCRLSALSAPLQMVHKQTRKQKLAVWKPASTVTSISGSSNVSLLFKRCSEWQRLVTNCDAQYHGDGLLLVTTLVEQTHISLWRHL
jgi:hypothetical protein